MIKLLSLLVGLLLTFNQLTSQDLMTDSLEESIVITHSKLPISLKQTSKDIVLISSEDIEKSGASDMSQLLSQQVGIQVNGAYSNPSINKSIYIQGGGSENVLFLINGSPITDPTSIGGSFDIRNLSLSSVESIEILKGSQSTLYGSNAVSGVINIITKSYTQDGSKINGSSSYGTYETMNHSLGYAYNHGKFSIDLQGAYAESAGLSEADGRLENSQFDHDGYQKKSLNTTLSYKVTEQFSVAPFIRLNSFSSSYDAGAFTDSPDRYESDFINTGLDLSLNGKNHTAKALYSYTNTNRLFISSFGNSPFDGTHQNLDLFDRYRISSNQDITIGINHQQYKMADDFATEPNPSESIFSPYFNYHLSFNQKTNLDIGYRYNKHSRYGSNSTYELSGSHWISDIFKFRATYGTGFKAPLIPQLFGAFGANPNLQPESSQYYNIGLRYDNSSTMSFELSYFNRNIDDIIVFTSDPMTFESLYVNLNNQKDYGLEAQLKYVMNNVLNLTLGYTYLVGSTSIDGGVETSDFLIRRPKHQFSIAGNYQVNPRFNIRLEINQVGQREDLFFSFDTFTTDQVSLDSYSIVNLSLQYSPLQNISFFASTINLFDTDFYEVYGFNTLGRSINAGFNWTMQ